MEENNNSENSTNVSEDTKPAKAKKENKKTDGKKSFSNFISTYKAEFRKITWPNRQTLIKETITVVFVSLLVGAVIFGYDTVFDFVRDRALDFMAK